MKVGNLQQKANWFLVGFVFGCIFIITLLLFAKVKAEQRAQELSYLTGDYSYYLEN
jgi:hypothetical protein